MRLPTLLALLVLSTGCAFTTMLPAKKLEKKQVVGQLALDVPGFLYIPRLSGQVTFGLGGGDLSIHGGSALLNVNAGATGRIYLGNWALSLQSEVLFTTFEESLFSAGSRFGFVTVNPRFGRLVLDDGFYGGFQLLGLAPFTASDTAEFSNPMLAAGAYVGYAWDLRGSFDFQFEAAATPIAAINDQQGLTVGVYPFGHIGIAVQYRREKQPPPPATPDSSQPPPVL